MTPICEVCFTSSWQPCEPEFPNAVKDPNIADGYMMCGYCFLDERLRDSIRVQVEKDAKIVESWHYKKGGYGVLADAIRSQLEKQ